MGGIETHVREVAPRLMERGFDVSVLTTDPSGDLPPQELVDGVPVRRIRAYPENRDYYFAPRLLSEIHRDRYDLVHLQGYHNLVAPLTMLAAAWTQTPYVVSFHSGGNSALLRRSVRGVQRLMLRPGFRRARRLVAVSQFELDLFRRSLRLSRARFALVRNGSHLPPVAVDRDSIPLVLSIGRLERYKGHHRVVQAWPRVVAAKREARLMVLGDGPYRSALESLVDRLGVASSVSIGSIPPGNAEQMATILGRSHLVTLLSDYEAHPVAVSEALAARRPVLVARTSGLAELVDAGLARGVTRNADDRQVASAILAELDHPHVADPSQLPTWNDCAAQLAAVYVEAVR
jgi:glycosyltransferase involved in cell wall biosynthesis